MKTERISEDPPLPAAYNAVDALIMYERWLRAVYKALRPLRREPRLRC